MSKVLEHVENNKNLVSAISQPVAVIGLETTGKKIAGRLVTPAVWVLNYAANKKAPDTIDVGLYGMGLLSNIAGVASIATGVVKAVVEDDMANKLRIIRAAEGTSFIRPTYHFSSAPAAINAMTIASLGGTAWKHPNGLWVYITDAKGYMVANYKPKKYVKLYRPIWPLQPLGAGKFRFTSE